MSEELNPHSTTESLTRILREFREERIQFKVFDDFDRAMSAPQESVDRNLETTLEPLKTVASRLYRIARDECFLIQVCEWKINYVADALLHAIESKNPVSLANNARALIEHVAAFTFVAVSCESLVTVLDGQGSEEKINQAIAKTEQTLKRCYYGKSPKSSDKTEAAPHIESECLGALEKFISDIRETYGFLCEFVHPNYGSNRLVSTGHLGTGRLNPPPDFHKKEIEAISRCCLLAMLFLRDQAIPFSAGPVMLGDLVSRCFSKGSKITNVFAKKSAIPQGDGQSRESAFFFPKARTSGEAIELTYRYLAESAIEVTGNKEIGGLSDGHIFDVFPTSHGRLWFKIPMVTA